VSRGGGPAGTRELLQLASRRDRIILPLWADALIGSTFSTAYSLKGLFPDQSSRREFVSGIRSASGASPLYGRILGDSLGAITAWRLAVLAAVAASVMSAMLVVRHTRAEEQTGRQELVAAGVVDRTAPLAAALQLVISVNLGVGVCIGGVLPILGLPVAGAFALGLSIAGCGIFFAGVAAVCAQLFESSRTANSASLTLLAFFYLVRAGGDVGHAAPWLRWASPIGWTEEVQPYAGDRWWVLAIPAAGAGLLVALALRLLGRRDFGSGVMPARPGPAYAAADTRGTLGLAWRMHRGAVGGWTAGVLVGALVFGSFVKNVEVLTGGTRVRKVMTELGGSQNMADAYIAAIMGVFGIMAAVLALTVITRARAEEADGRIELIFAGTPSRARWIMSHVVFAVLGPALVLAAAGFGAGLSDGLGAHDVAHVMGSLLGAAFAQLPAVLLVTALAVVLFTAFPRYTAVSWGLFGAFAFLTLVGPELKVSQYVLDVSPFSQVPKLPGSPVATMPLVVMAALGLAGLAAGLAVFRRRDLLA
jgi:ABC-2 type transport system permease protein